MDEVSRRNAQGSRLGMDIRTYIGTYTGVCMYFVRRAGESERGPSLSRASPARWLRLTAFAGRRRIRAWHSKAYETVPHHQRSCRRSLAPVQHAMYVRKCEAQDASDTPGRRRRRRRDMSCPAVCWRRRVLRVLVHGSTRSGRLPCCVVSCRRRRLPIALLGMVAAVMEGEKSV